MGNYSTPDTMVTNTKTKLCMN